MKLLQLATDYITFKQSMGMRFRTESVILNAFCRAMGDIHIVKVTPSLVQSYLNGTGPITTFWHRKFEALNGFYRFAISRGYISSSPLPMIIPKRPAPFQPYIYTHDQFRQLIEMTDILSNSRRCQVQPATFRTLLLLLYGTGLRISEALSFTLADVDLPASLHCSQYQVLQDQMGTNRPSTDRCACHLRKDTATTPTPGTKELCFPRYAPWKWPDTKHCRTNFSYAL